MSRRIYYDINCSVGKMSYRHECTKYKMSELVQEMDYFEISGAAVWSNVGKDYSFVKGNEELIRDCKNSIHPIYTIVPYPEYEIKNGKNYLDYLVQNGAKAFQMFPKSLNHGFTPFYLKDVAEFMIGHQLPLIVNIYEIELNELEPVLKAFPNLQIVLLNAGWRDNRFIFPLLNTYKNLYIELSSNQANDVLEVIKQHFGLSNVLFGSNYPFKSIGASKAAIEFANITEEEKDMVAYLNSCRLFHIDPNSLKQYSGKETKLDNIAKRIDQGMKLDGLEVIDAHAHVVDSKDESVSYQLMFHTNEDCIVEKMNRLGIDKTVLLASWEGITTDAIAANDTAAKIKEKYPDRFEVFASYNPNYKDELPIILDKYNIKNGFCGLKPYWTFHNSNLLGKEYEEWFQYGNANHLIMMVHSGPEFIAQQVGELAEKYPDMTFILAHSGTSYETASCNMKMAKAHENIYLEITFTSVVEGIIEHMVENVGADKILFGTDIPMRDSVQQLAWVAYAKISEEDKKKILGLNVKRLLDEVMKYQKSNL